MPVKPSAFRISHITSGTASKLSPLPTHRLRSRSRAGFNSYSLAPASSMPSGVVRLPNWVNSDTKGTGKRILK